MTDFEDQEIVYVETVGDDFGVETVEVILEGQQGPQGATGPASTIPGPQGATGTAGNDGATGATGPAGTSNWFTFDFTVPSEDTVVEEPVYYKIVLDFPEAGYVSIDFDDIPYAHQAVCQVYDRVNDIMLTDWQGFDWLAGVFAGSASAGDELTITVTWNDWG